jgi:hypothetical protein
LPVGRGGVVGDEDAGAVVVHGFRIHGVVAGGPRLEPTKKAVADLKDHGLKVEFASFPGGHEWHV